MDRDRNKIILALDLKPWRPFSELAELLGWPYEALRSVLDKLVEEKRVRVGKQRNGELHYRLSLRGKFDKIDLESEARAK